MSTWFESLSERARSRVARLLPAQSGLAGATNALGDMRVQEKGFSPGQRTADEGMLGDGSGQVDVQAAGLSGTLTWELHRRGALGAAPVDTTQAPAADAVTVRAGDGGAYRLRVNPGSGGSDGEILLSAPHPIRVLAPLDSVEDLLSELGAPAGDQQALWEDVLEQARHVSHHLLRPLNVRLYWTEADIPAHFSPQSPPTTPTMTAGSVTTTDAGDELVPLSFMVSVEGAAPDFLETTLLPDLPELPDWIGGATVADVLEGLGFGTATEGEAWGADPTFVPLGWAMVRAGLGARTWDGTAVDPNTGTGGMDDQVLATLAAELTSSNEWGSGPSVIRDAWVKGAGRRIGVGVARCVCRLVGMDPRDAAALPDPEDSSADPAIVLSDLMDPEPQDPVRDLLGFHRPANRPLSDLVADLGAGADPSRWSDLASYHRDLDQAGLSLFGPHTRLDVLAGLVAEESLEDARARAFLAAPYGGHALTHGDQDHHARGTLDAVYGGETQAVQPAHGYVARLQADLRLLGIMEGVEGAQRALLNPGLYGYRRWEDNSTDHFDGDLGTRPQVADNDEDDRKRGHTGFAVREFQIASRYPNTVVERLDAVERYAARLQLTDTGNPNPPASGTPAAGVNGTLSVPDGLKLRRWRFQRRRNPIVVEARSGANHGQIDDDRLGAPDAHPNQNPRMFVVDRSGWFRSEDQHRVLGDWSSAIWGGPRSGQAHTTTDITVERAVNMSQADWDPAQAANPQDRALREQLLGTYRIVASVADVEAGGAFDGMNCYDDAVFSLPLFHHTMTLNSGGRDGAARPNQMAQFVRWLQNPLEPHLPQGTTSLVQRATNNAQEESDLQDAMHEVYQYAFGHFGLGGGPLAQGTERYDGGFVTVEGLKTGQVQDGNTTHNVDMTAAWPGRGTAGGRRQQALYQAYQEWLRSWPWMHRITAALRTKERGQNQQPFPSAPFSAALRALLFAWDMEWFTNILGEQRTGWNGQHVVRDILGSEEACAIFVRLEVKAPLLADVAWAVIAESQNQNAGGAQRVNAMVDMVTDAFTTAYFRPPLQGGMNAVAGQNVQLQLTVGGQARPNFPVIHPIPQNSSTADLAQALANAVNGAANNPDIDAHAHGSRLVVLGPQDLDVNIVVPQGLRMNDHHHDQVVRVVNGQQRRPESMVSLTSVTNVQNFNDADAGALQGNAPTIQEMEDAVARVLRTLL